VGMDDLEIEVAVLNLVAPEVLGGQQSGRKKKKEKSRDGAWEHNDLGLRRADQQLGCIVPETLELIE
jgi:hypothetical protein